MAQGSSAEEWLRFFMEAGLPKESSETYAVTFSKNQVKLDMLEEIKKEYLVDMGISLVGHIIAILRHAKTVHEESVTRTTLAKTEPSNAQVFLEKQVDPKISPSLNKPLATRMLDHYMPREPAEADWVEPEGKVGVKRAWKKPPAAVSGPTVIQGASGGSSGHDERKRFRLSDPPTEPPAPVKPRQIIINNGVNSSSDKKRVFERLGEPARKIEPTRKIEPLRKNLLEEVAVSRGVLRQSYDTDSLRIRNSSGTSTISKEMGGLQKQTESRPVGKPLPYAGILKKSLLPESSGRTMHADRPSLPVHSRTASLPNRVGPSISSLQGLTLTIDNREQNQRSSIKERLGKTGSLPKTPTKMVQCEEKPGKAAAVKRVCFGTVSQQLIPSVRRKREEESLPEDSYRYQGSIGMGTALFDRLGQYRS